jgi:hypothetical protein
MVQYVSYEGFIVHEFHTLSNKSISNIKQYIMIDRFFSSVLFSYIPMIYITSIVFKARCII